MPTSTPGKLAIFDFSLEGLPLPLLLRPAHPLSDEEIMAFSRRNRLYPMEKTPQGDLYIMTPVGGNGSRWEAFVIRELGYWAEDYGGEAFSSNGGFNLPDGSMMSPDTAWISAERWSGITEKERSGYPPLRPDFLIEVLSESDSRRVLEAKMEVWMANGAQLAWMIDPYAATVTIYRKDVASEILQRPDCIEADEPVLGFRLTTAKRWLKTDS